MKEVWFEAMKESLFGIGCIFLTGSVGCLFIKLFSQIFDPNKRLAEKLAPYWFYITSLCFGIVCFVVLHFCF